MLNRILFPLVVGFHMLIVIINLLAFFIIPFSWLILDIPFWFSIFLIIPIESFIIYVTFDRNPCPLTRYENSIRKQLGMKPIGAFIGHYFLKKGRNANT